MTDVTLRPRVLLCATTTGYQTRMFDEAATRLGVELVLATDRCDRLDDPWRDRAVAVRFHDEAASLHAVLQALAGQRLDGVLAVGDRPVVLAALVAEARRLPWHSVAGARASRDKRRFRACQRAHGLPAPWALTVPAGQVDAARRRVVSVRGQAARALGQPRRDARQRCRRTAGGAGARERAAGGARRARAARRGRRGASRSRATSTATSSPSKG